jgi:type IV pilus assembly protein PilB
MNPKKAPASIKAKEKKPSPPTGRDKLGQIVPFLMQEGYLNEKQVSYAVRVQSKLEAPKLLLDILKELSYIDDRHIKKVLRRHRGSIRIGNLLVELGYLRQVDLEASLEIQAKEVPKKKLGEVLVKHNFIKESALLEALSMQLGFPLAEPGLATIDPELIGKAPIRVYRSNNFIPLSIAGEKIMVAFAEPTNERDIETAKKFLGNNIIPAIASKQSIDDAIDRIKPGSKPLMTTSFGEESVVEIADSIINEAIKRDASDIHIEPREDRLHIRFRQDGVLVHYRDYPSALIPPLTSRFKIMAEADITEKRRHQGGRLMYNKDGRYLDLRASFYVTVHGEKIVLRLLNRQSQLFDIGDIGMSPRMLQRFREDAIERPSGVLIITGPTGSGKTTTVYAAINYLNDPKTSIITAEEPVEYIINGISQCSIDPKLNLTFEETLRHIVRQDPDVVVIGEVRDPFSARVAVQAALTGHKVLTTFHTEDSIGGLIRLLNMDIDAFLISSTVVCIVAQRLLRSICPECRIPHKPTPEELRRLGYSPKDIKDAEFAIGRGCPKCDHSGYKGRTAVFELLVLEEEVRDAILERKTSFQIRNISIETTGLVTLFEDGIAKAAEGKTSINEVLRCLPKLQKPRPLPEIRRLLGY